jgi:hypothetical protein
MLHKLKIYLSLWYSAILVSGIFGFPKFLTDFLLINRQVKKRISSLTHYRLKNPGELYEKYLNTNLWVCETLIRVHKLKLHKSPKKLRVLDLGTGCGYFPYICSFYGHSAESLDLGENELYNRVILALDVVRYDQKIVAFSKLELDKKYDLITAFMICFNGHKSINLWDIKEWDYFLDSLRLNNLKSGGKVYLSFNAESDPLEPINLSLLQYFSSMNSKISKNNVSLTFE